MKEKEIIEPVIKWRVNGDNSHTARIDYGDGRVFVHTNKNLKVLQKLVNDRYLNPNRKFFKL